MMVAERLEQKIYICDVLVSCSIWSSECAGALHDHKLAQASYHVQCRTVYRLYISVIGCRLCVIAVLLLLLARIAYSKTLVQSFPPPIRAPPPMSHVAGRGHPKSYRTYIIFIMPFLCRYLPACDIVRLPAV